MKRSEYLRQRRTGRRGPRRPGNILLWIAALGILLGLVYQLPPVKERFSWRIYEWRTSVQYWVDGLGVADAEIDEEQQLELIVRATTVALTQTAFEEATIAIATPTPESTGESSISPTASIAPTPTYAPIPNDVFLDGVNYVDQHGRWNYCGPANLTMALNFWGWAGTRDDVARVVKPGVNDPSLDFIDRGKPDKNVMPYEMAVFVSGETDLSVVTRSGGDLALLRRLIANGFPVIVEKGYVEKDFEGVVAWLGHYQFVTGYNEEEGTYIVQDTWLKPGANLVIDSQTLLDGWRAFNYLFMVIYPPEREAEVFDLLGLWADNEWANRHALELSVADAASLSGLDEYFAWFNKGTSHVALLEYADAAFAYDYALFVLYPALHDDDRQRPYRLMWYQTGPYWAYFYTGRYQDVIDRANHTLYNTYTDPTLEESLYWRGMAYNASGQTNAAIADFRQSVYFNPNFSPGWSMLSQLGAN